MQPYNFPRYFIQSLILIFSLITTSVFAGELHIAVAANFTKPIKQLKQQFEKESKHQVIISIGATGQLYTQIKYGAPFDIFLAADMKRPQMLINEGKGVADTLFTYAVGQLVLWSPRANFVDIDGKVLSSGTFRYLAIAHPRLAPYGNATKQALEKLGLWQTLQGKMVRGNNVSQAYQFTATGNAELGFIALSHYKAIKTKSRGSHWLIPNNLYDPIQQGAVLLKKGENNPVAQAFFVFLRSPIAQQIIGTYGYIAFSDWIKYNLP
ncbi:molybdate ABC transporter substrate-binding protein [Candidatus Parabeggiatoa sp. HSG14]|uniref:molybdate ABC transporter substrate-binding protein n=1 Tax=Candidatus Parabeggiatoa sp. HSG14 TaxID=3055593 RepID=UPI0025A919E3|nr:molybdate ABC transporter substrate-binding protein [Thiotrichales bacterium HSG14]